LKEPSHDVFEEGLKKIDQEIENTRATLQQEFAKVKMIREGGKLKGSNVSIKQFMTEKAKEIRVIDEQLVVLEKDVTRLSNQFDELMDKKKSAGANMKKGFNKEEDIIGEIESLNHTYNTKSMTANEEKQILAEIKKLEKSKKFASEIGDIDPQITAVKKQKGELLG
jgi:uncharacterized coiled-coil DUF342 family protein